MAAPGRLRLGLASQSGWALAGVAALGVLAVSQHANAVWLLACLAAGVLAAAVLRGRADLGRVEAEVRAGPDGLRVRLRNPGRRAEHIGRQT